MEVLQDTNPNESPVVKAFLNDVLIAEQRAFDRVFTRFCLLNGLNFETAFMQIETSRPYPQTPNYGTYHYKGSTLKDNTIKSHFLMSRDLVVVEGQELPSLIIKWNVELLDETKEN